MEASLQAVGQSQLFSEEFCREWSGFVRANPLSNREEVVIIHKLAVSLIRLHISSAFSVFVRLPPSFFHPVCVMLEL